ncbi:MAG: META domain-containing protein [Pararhodobacter sp.]|nr:META domain-containing protein [Pararhodobacter sp.]
MRLGLILAAVLALGSGCVAEGQPDGAWQVLTLGPLAIEAADGVTLTLADGQASGRSGCNRFSGTYAVDGAAISFGPMGSTRMACRGRTAEIEAQFNAVIATVTGWQRDGEALILTADALPVLRATPQLDPVQP